MRKLAMVLDVKKSYDVFGESLVFALSVDIAMASGWLNHPASAAPVGAAIHRTLRVVGSGTIDALGRAGREAYARGGAAQLPAAIGVEVERASAKIEPILRDELTATPS